MQQLIIKLCEIKMKSSGGVRLKLSYHDKLVNKEGLGWMAYGEKRLRSSTGISEAPSLVRNGKKAKF